MGKRKLLFVVGVDWSFVSHRLPIAVEAIKRGYEVHLAATITDKYDMLAAQGIIIHPLNIDRGGTNPFTELKLIFSIWQLFRRVKPDIVHLVTIKPVLYGGIVARFTSIKAIVAAVPGLGFVFLSKGIKAQVRRIIVSVLYFLALRHKNIKIIFQNPDDKKKILSITKAPEEKTIMIRGSGADLSQYPFIDIPDTVPMVVMAARLLKDKGVYEFIEAARILKNKGIKARFCLIGSPDTENPSSVSESELDIWKKEAIVEIWGYRKDIAKIFADSYMVVLPSYSEGLPKVLIEAAACGRAVVTTDVSGCRDAIEADKTGLLIPVKDAQALASAIEKLLLDKDLCIKMGKAGRELAEREFTIKKVVDAHLKIYDEIS